MNRLSSWIVGINQTNDGLVRRQRPLVPSCIGLLPRPNPKRDVRSIECSTDGVEVFSYHRIPHIVDKVVWADSNLGCRRIPSLDPHFPHRHIWIAGVAQSRRRGEDLQEVERSRRNFSRIPIILKTTGVYISKSGSDHLDHVTHQLLQSFYNVLSRGADRIKFSILLMEQPFAPRLLWAYVCIFRYNPHSIAFFAHSIAAF
jgi:hypothetical protein